MRLGFCSLALCGVLAVSSFASLRAMAPAQTDAGSAAASPAYASDPAFHAAMVEGAQLFRHRQFAFAASSYKKANKIAGGHCLECLKGEYTAQIEGGSFKDAAGTAQAMEAIATTPAGKSAAEFREANALFYAAGDKPKPEKLQAVHAVVTEALSNAPQNAAALFLDGKVMARLGKMDEAKAAFTRCVSCVMPTDPAKLRAEHFAQDPELALHKMAPPFKVTALDGSEFNLDAMGGKVVLIDFWATWCPSCVAEIPHMKRIAQQFAGQPLVILSVSWDSDDQKWKDYIAKNEMTWLQYRDADHKLAEEFGINAIPHYFTIDSDGVLTAEVLGGGADIEGKLRKLVAKAKEAQKETVAGVSNTKAGLTVGN